MEGARDRGAGTEEPPGVRGRGTVRRLFWELERPSSAPGLRPGSEPAYNRTHGKWQAAERESEGVVVVTTAGTT
jgi:hypothetical protein